MTDAAPETVLDGLLAGLSGRALVVVTASRPQLGNAAMVAQVAEAGHRLGLSLRVLDAGVIGEWQGSDAPANPVERALVLLHNGCPPGRQHRLLGQVISLFRPAEIFVQHRIEPDPAGPS